MHWITFNDTEYPKSRFQSQGIENLKNGTIFSITIKHHINRKSKSEKSMIQWTAIPPTSFFLWPVPRPTMQYATSEKQLLAPTYVLDKKSFKSRNGNKKLFPLICAPLKTLAPQQWVPPGPMHSIDNECKWPFNYHFKVKLCHINIACWPHFKQNIINNDNSCTIRRMHP